MVELANKSKPFILVGPRSTPSLTYGMSIGFDLLISGFEEREIPHRIIDRSEGMVGRKVGEFSLGGAWASLRQVLKCYVRMFGAAGIYITIGTSKAGLLRDLLMLIPAILFHKRTVLHLKGGGFLDFYNDQSSWLQAIITAVYKRVDAIIVLGNLLRDQFSFLPNATELTHVAPNGLPDELDQRVRTASDAKSLKHGEPISLLYLSNMIESKGYREVLEACHILHERKVPVHCDFCGKFVQTVHSEDADVCSPEDSFRQHIQDWGLEEVVHYHGVVRGEQKHERLTRAHVFLLPTKYPWEGQPISIVEAMAYGCPVITTEYRGIPEQVVAGSNGEYVGFGDADAIADAIESLYTEPERYHAYSKASVNRFQNMFTREAHLNRIIPLILHG